MSSVFSGDGLVEQRVYANGLEINYLESGAGDPLLLLHGGTMSARRSWSEHLPLFAKHFRVIAPDARGHGKTLNPSGQYSYPLLADDAIALIEALRLDRPLLCGFSNGGIVASLMCLRKPTAARALINSAGYDLFNSSNYARLRQVFGGDSRAVTPDLDGFAQQNPDWVLRMQEDHDDTQGAGHWRRLISQAWPMWSRPMDYGFEDFRRISVPTLILVGDRDAFCTVDEAISVYQLLSYGELAVVPNLDHGFSRLAAEIALDFLMRHRSIPQESD